jgi:ketosteroid isomerase-like protein
MKLSQDLISNHIKQWINAWNSKDIDTILSLYCDNIELSSPKVKKLLSGYETNIINNINDLKRYFSIGLKKFPNLKFEPIDFVTKGNIIILEYVAYPNDQVKWNVLEKFELDKNGKVMRSSVYYSIEEETQIK